MFIRIALLVVLFTLLSETYAEEDSCTPLWPRLEFGSIFSDYASSEKIVIKFNTRSECPKSYLVLNVNSTIRKLYCQSANIKCSQKMNNYTTYIQRCSVSEIIFGQNLTYLPYGSNSSSGTAIPYSSEPFSTTIIHPNSTSQARFIVLADWSQLHKKIGIYASVNQTIDKILRDFGLHGIIVNGDIAYDLDSNNGTNYQDFLNMLSRSGKYVPVLMIAGNHEHITQDDELLFYNTFQQYGAEKTFTSNLSIGSVFFATFDPYVDLYTKIQQKNLKSQVGPAFKYFAQALNNGVKSEKIIIPISHYPLKCSAKAEDCQKDVVMLKPYFDQMLKNDIKFYIGAHYHTYERLYPYCKNGTFNLVSSPYNPQILKDCMVSVIEGIAGNDDKIVESYKVIQNYTAHVSFNKTGVGLLTITPNSVKFQHYSSDHILTLEDQFVINYQPKKKILIIEE